MSLYAVTYTDPAVIVGCRWFERRDGWRGMVAPPGRMRQ